MNEYISREAAKTLIHDRAIEMALNNVGFKADASDILEQISKRSMDWIDEIQAADVRPVVRGDWVSVHDGYGICSNCHRGDHIDPLAGFCRFCGADMREVKADGKTT